MCIFSEQAFCRASECFIQLRKHYVARHDALSIRESTLSRVTMLYLIGESILSRFVMLYQIVQALCRESEYSILQQ